MHPYMEYCATLYSRKELSDWIKPVLTNNYGFYSWMHVIAANTNKCVSFKCWK